MNKIISLILALVLCLGLAIPVVAAEKEQAFSDVEESDWHYKYVMELYERGGVNGVGDGKFNPNGTVTAAEFMTIAARLVTPQYIDMSSASEGWAFPYYDALIKTQIIHPSAWVRSMNDVYDMWTNTTHSGLNDSMTREKMSEILYDLAEYRGEDMSILPNIQNNIPDSAKCSKDEFWAYSAGIITGKAGGYFDPHGNMTRAEMCTVFCRLMNYVEREKVVVQESYTSDYFVEGGLTKGQLKDDVARKYGKMTLENIRLGKDEKGVYVYGTAPVLPEGMQGCKIHYRVRLFEYDNYYDDGLGQLAFWGEDLQSGESFKAYFHPTWENNVYIKASEVDFAQVYVYLTSPIFSDPGLTYTSDTTTKTQVLETIDVFGNGTNTLVDMDVSHIYAGIGK